MISRFDEIRKEANDWQDKYLDLTARLAEAHLANGLNAEHSIRRQIVAIADFSRWLDPSTASAPNTRDFSPCPLRV